MSLVRLEDALERLMTGAMPIRDTKTVPLRAAHGRRLGADVVAQRTQPGFDASAMDGYALRASDAGEADPLRVVGEVSAGQMSSEALAPGEAMRIFTGAPLPKGADAVLLQEDAERSGDQLRALTPVRIGQHIRPAGNDFFEGQLLVPEDSLLTAARVALAGSGGHAHLVVRRRPRVAIAMTGDELVLPGEPVGDAKIVASNGYAIAALAEAAGGVVDDLRIAPDDASVIRQRLEEASASGADVFVTIGGASVGDRDLVAQVFDEAGVSLDFWKVAMRPGKPVLAGRRGALRVIGLPGNPASSLVAATLFLKPLLRRLAGLPDMPLMADGILGADVEANDHRAEFMRAIRVPTAGEDRPTIKPLLRQDSSLLSTYAAADVLLFRPVNAPAAVAGDVCRFVRLD